MVKLNEKLNTDFLNPELFGRFLSPAVVTAVELGAGYPVCLHVRSWVSLFALTSSFNKGPEQCTRFLL